MISKVSLFTCPTLLSRHCMSFTLDVPKRKIVVSCSRARLRRHPVTNSLLLSVAFRTACTSAFRSLCFSNCYRSAMAVPPELVSSS